MQTMLTKDFPSFFRLILLSTTAGVYIFWSFWHVSLTLMNSFRPVLHHCVVIFFWSSGIMECTRVLFTFENGVPLMRKGASVVWHHSLLLMYSFNKTEAAVFSCRLCFMRAFPFTSLIQ